MFANFLRRPAGLLLRLCGIRRLPLARCMAREALRQWEQHPDAGTALAGMLRSYDEFYGALGRLAIRAEGGVHPKHRLIGYHEFFLRQIGGDDSVLDVGCNTGALTRDLAGATRGRVVGIEIDDRLLAQAKAFATPVNVDYVCADVTQWRPEGPFDVVVLSNVLEHIEKRRSFLRKLLAATQPGKVLLRVPMKERDWLVPLRDELGVDSRLDAGHHIEYTEGGLREELAAAGLQPEERIIRFGEYLCVCVPGETRR